MPGADCCHRKEQSIFFYVSPVKLYVMSLVTFGFYEIFWFYKNWHYVNEHTHRKVFPLLNAIFCAFTFYGLMKEIAQAALVQNRKFDAPWLLLAISYFLVSNLSGPFRLAIFLVPLPLIVVQNYVNSLNLQSPTPINDRFTAANWIAIVIIGGFELLRAIWPFLAHK